MSQGDYFQISIWFVKKALNEVKAIGLQFSSNI